MAKGKKRINWQDKYDIVGVTPGIIIHPKVGKIDFSDPLLPIETIEKLIKANCQYVKVKDIQEASN